MASEQQVGRHPDHLVDAYVAAARPIVAQADLGEADGGDAAVREAFQRHGVTKLKADWTNGDPVITKFLQRFGRVGVPFYVLYPGNSEEPIVFPELLTKSIILEKLETISRNVASQ